MPKAAAKAKAKKPAPKAKAKAAPKKVAKLHSAKAVAPKENFMTKLLKEKEAHLKQGEAEGKHHHAHKEEGHFQSHARSAFVKFAGPRRRAAS